MITTHITFIHGMANKPAPDQLRRIWLSSLAEDRGINLGFDPESEGVSVSFVYWADLFYDKPIEASSYESKKDELEATVPKDDTLDFSKEDYNQKWMTSMHTHFPIDEEEDTQKYVDPDVPDSLQSYERILIPWFLKKKIMKRFLKEVHDYLFNKNDIQDIIRKRVIDDLNAHEVDNHIIVSHSQGTVIAYDVVNNVDECKIIQGFMTFGSPLGIDEVQDKLHHTRKNGFPSKLEGDWFNVYDPFDVVARLDPVLSNDYKKDNQSVVKDIRESNWGKWRHSATKYYKGEKLRKALRILTNREE